MKLKILTADVIAIAMIAPKDPKFKKVTSGVM